MSLVIPVYPLPTFRSSDGSLLVMDPVRKKKVKASPEEYVRQQIMAYLHHQLGVPYGLMQVEQEVIVNGRKKRFDLSVRNRDTQVVLLLECKRPGIPLDKTAFLQLANYNFNLRSPYCWLSNGEENFIVHLTGNGPVEVETFPHFSQFSENHPT